MMNYIIQKNYTINGDGLMFKDWGKGNEPPDWVTKEECQEMIDNAYTKT